MKIYIVGGYLRDKLLGIGAKDKDYLVVGASPEQMIALGFRPVGQDFPVFLHPVTKEEYALARTERKSGQGYKGFTFFASKDVTLEQDLMRRDFTVNAIAQEINLEGLEVGPLQDPYGGQLDLQKKILRHVSPAFVEDPLRILRLARFMAKLSDFQIDPNTHLLVQKMVQQGELKFLVPDRVWLEISKGLLEKKPSRMLDTFHSIGALSDLFPGSMLERDVFVTTKKYIDLGADLKTDLQSQFAYLMILQSVATIHDWANQYRVPNEIKQFAQVSSRIYQLCDGQKHDAEVIVELFNSCDAWRKPERFYKALTHVQAIGLSTQTFRTCIDAALAVDAGSIAKAIGANGLEIQTAVSNARKQAIASAL